MADLSLANSNTPVLRICSGSAVARKWAIAILLATARRLQGPLRVNLKGAFQRPLPLCFLSRFGLKHQSPPAAITIDWRPSKARSMRIIALIVLALVFVGTAHSAGLPVEDIERLLEASHSHSDHDDDFIRAAMAVPEFLPTYTHPDADRAVQGYQESFSNSK